VAGGLPVLEVTLRTEAALASIRAIRARSAAGNRWRRYRAGLRTTGGGAEAAAHFAVSPGATVGALEAGRSGGLPLLPAR